MKGAATALLLCMIPLLAGTSDAASEETQSGQEQELTVEAYLRLIGEAYDIYFTVEEAGEPGDISNFIESRRVKVCVPPPAGSLETVLKDLFQQVPRAEAIPLADGGRVVHIRDKQLRDRDGYVLDRVVESIRFKGTPSGLRDYLAGTMQGFAKSFNISTAGPFGDNVTQLDIDAKQIKVRDLLTDYLPLDRYKRTLWISSVRLASPIETKVIFCGPRKECIPTERPARLATGGKERAGETPPPAPPSEASGTRSGSSPGQDLRSAEKPPAAAAWSKTGGPGWLIASAAVAAGGICLIVLLRFLRRKRA